MVEVRLENLTHSYDGKTNAVENINLTFRDKTANGLLGPSGCGKTTLLSIIAGLLNPTRGKVYFDGQDVTELPPEKRNVAIVFQFPVVYAMSVLDNLKFPLDANTKMSKDEKRKKVLEIANLLDLKTMLGQTATKLGPADKQRVALGRSLVREPSIFLFDEPLSSIEPDKKSFLKTKIKEVQKRLWQTTVYVTHDQTEALTFADNVAVMNRGKVIQFDRVEKLYKKPNSDFVGYFIGFPGMNILNGCLKGNKIYLNDFLIKIPENVNFPEHVTEVKVGVRPEDIKVSGEKRRDWIPFKCDLFENLGKDFGILHLTTEHHKIKVKSKLSFPQGSDVWAHFPFQRLHFFDQKGKRITTF